MMSIATSKVVKQHLIDPEICIQCNTCEDTCPSHAITHGERNYVVDAAKCNQCLECIGPCPTGAIDNWRTMPLNRIYSIKTQLGWVELPPELSTDEVAAATVEAAEMAVSQITTEATAPFLAAVVDEIPVQVSHYGATVPPWSAAHPYTNLYGVGNPLIATVTGNARVTEVGRECDTHHIVLDFGRMPFLVIEGQSIGIIPPGTDAAGRTHHARLYSIASPRDGERSGYNNVSLTVKRVLEDRQGNPVRGVASNYLCDLKVGDSVQVIGPFGTSFLMPNHPHSHIVMICSGTGSAPMRAMLLWRYRQYTTGKFESGKLMLFFGARTQEELPFFGRLHKLPPDFIDVNLAFSRVAGQPKRYVQDLMRERSTALAKLLADPDSYFYVCGLKSMEEGVVIALRDIAEQAGLQWETLSAKLKREGRLHLEVY